MAYFVSAVIGVCAVYALTNTNEELTNTISFIRNVCYPLYADEWYGTGTHLLYALSKRVHLQSL